MNRTTIHRVVVGGTAALAAVAGLLAPIAVGAGPARGEPSTECSPMAHPPETDAGSGNPLTRPGQLGGLTQAPGPGEMPMDCPAIGHG